MHPLVEFKTRAMTEEEVLAVLRDIHRQWSDEDGNPEAVIDYETTINHWCSACGIDTWYGFNLGEFWNEFFRVEFTPLEWSQVVEPGRRRTLGGVCKLIATRARVEEIEKAAWFGKPCKSAGSFLAIRALLARAGGDVQDLRPSTPLARYFGKRDHPAFLRDLLRVAPGRLPVVRYVRPSSEGWLLWAFICCFLVGLVLAGLLKFTDWSFLAYFLVGDAVIGSAAMGAFQLSTSYRAPLRIEFGELVDFGDLARTVSGEGLLRCPRPKAAG
jgi:hypothetical protein